MPNRANHKQADGNVPPEGAAPDPAILQIHCPRLGGQAPLSYCLKPAQHSPCFRIMDCWWQTIDIETFLKERLQPAEFKSLLEGPRPPGRLDLILEVLERLKKTPSSPT